MRNAAALAPLVVVLVAFEGYCLFLVVRRPVKVLPRWVWALLCVLSVPLGGILFLVLGRGEQPGPVGPAASAGTGAGTGPVAADRFGARRTVIHPVDRSAPPALTTSGLTKRYRDHVALDEVSISVPSGSVFGLVGPNGAGKTTLLAILAGLRHPSDGHFEFGVAPGKVALLPDTPHFEPWLTAREVVDLARELSLPGSDQGRTVDALARTGLLDAADRPSGGFSRGMLQRLGLAATIVGEPDLLLLDEPCSALDPLGRREVLDLVAGLGGDRTVLFCSHILGDVQEVCDTVGVLRDGRLLFEGQLDDLLVGRAAPMYAIRIRPPVEPVVDALRSADWVQAVERVGAEELHVAVGDLATAEQQLVGLLAEVGARVVSVVPAGMDLEQVFLELVR